MFLNQRNNFSTSAVPARVGTLCNIMQIIFCGVKVMISGGHSKFCKELQNSYFRQHSNDFGRRNDLGNVVMLCFESKEHMFYFCDGGTCMSGTLCNIMQIFWGVKVMISGGHSKFCKELQESYFRQHSNDFGQCNPGNDLCNVVMILGYIVMYRLLVLLNRFVVLFMYCRLNSCFCSQV